MNGNFSIRFVSTMLFVGKYSKSNSTLRLFWYIQLKDMFGIFNKYFWYIQSQQVS